MHPKLSKYEILGPLASGGMSEVWLAKVKGPPGFDKLVVIKTILKMLGKPESLIQFVTDRPGHDRRYSLDSSKLRRELGWKPEVIFEEGIGRTVDWYRKNQLWLQRARSGEYRNYYERHYTRREETFTKAGTKS